PRGVAILIQLWFAFVLQSGVGVQGPSLGCGSTVNRPRTAGDAQGIVPTHRADPWRGVHADDLRRQRPRDPHATSTVTTVRIPAAEEEHLGAILVEGRGPPGPGTQELVAQGGLPKRRAVEDR